VTSVERAAFAAPKRPFAASVALLALLAVAGCQSAAGGRSGFSETSQHGYVVSPTALEQVPVGSSRDQVLIALGSPSTTGNYGNEVFYYISQTRHRAAAFMPDKVVDQRVVAVYFDAKSNVERIANYGMQDGKVFDFISRTTPTGGADSNFLQQVLSGVIGFGGNPFGR
jgi:outer membrane protein assembly factor BamE (lipoprotein component of BamABCDE complex)